ncbi:MAG: hypothetical protein ACKPKO_52805, partial [Candidatus Fonsibacter sp.]
MRFHQIPLEYVQRSSQARSFVARQSLPEQPTWSYALTLSALSFCRVSSMRIMRVTVPEETSFAISAKISSVQLPDRKLV